MNLSDSEIQVALATALHRTNLQRDDEGRLIGKIVGVMSECPDVVPDWPRDIDQAMKLEECLDACLRDAYENNLSQMGTDVETATARQRSEAALLTLQADAAGKLTCSALGVC